MSRRQEKIVRASEIGLYAYCARAWWLGRVKGHRSVNQAALKAGEVAHQAHGRQVVSYHRLRGTAYLLLGLALLVGLVLLVMLAVR